MGDSHEMTGGSEAELFELVELHSGDHLEMSGSSVMSH